MNRLWLFLLFILLQVATLFPETDSQSQIYLVNTKTTAVSSLIEGSPIVFTLDSSTQVVLLKKVGQWGQIALSDNPSKTGFLKLKSLTDIDQVDQIAFLTSPDESQQQSVGFNDDFPTSKKPKQSFLIAAIVVLLLAGLLLSVWKVFPGKVTKLEPRAEAERPKPDQLTSALKKPDPTKWVPIDPKPEKRQLELAKPVESKQATIVLPVKSEPAQEKSHSKSKTVSGKPIAPVKKPIDSTPKPPIQKIISKPEPVKTIKKPVPDQSNKQEVIKAEPIHPLVKFPSPSSPLEKSPKSESSAESHTEDKPRDIKKHEKIFEKPVETKRSKNSGVKSGNDNQCTGRSIIGSSSKNPVQVPEEAKHELTKFDLNTYSRIEATLQQLPDYLNMILFDELGAIYNPLNKHYHDPANLNELRNYLGTYFPRSFIETKSIIYELCRTKTVQQMLSEKKQLNILDLGAGAGGNLVGLLDFLNSVNCLPTKIIVTSVDGSELALNYQENILNKIKSRIRLEIDFRKHIKKYSSRQDFIQHIKSLPVLNREYDFILASKFINSLYKSAKNGEYNGTYREFCEFMEKNLKEDGIAVSVENVDKANGVYFPIIMNREVCDYISTSPNLRYLLPLSCALHYRTCKKIDCFSKKSFLISHQQANYDSSNITFNVFSHTHMAQNYYREINQKDKYQISWNGYGPNCCDKGSKFYANQERLQHIPDGFSLKGQLKS